MQSADRYHHLYSLTEFKARYTALPAVLLAASALLYFGSELAAGPQDTPPSGTNLCWRLQGASYSLLDTVENIESCGARLEVLHLQENLPISGAYGGVYVFAEQAGISAASPNYPKRLLISREARADVDAAILSLIGRQDEEPSISTLRK